MKELITEEDIVKVAECIKKQLFDSKEIPQITVETID